MSEFVAVVETEGFTSAAKRLGISVAQVSRQVRDLEARLSTKLLYRTTRRVSVTEMGNIYFQHCRHALDGLEEAERAMTNQQSTPTGVLKLTAPVTYGENRVAPLVNSFVALYPELEVRLHLTNRMLDLVDEGYDLAIRLGKLEDSTMMAKHLASRTQYLCASPDYLSAYGIPHSLTELDQHSCLRGTLDHWRFQENGKIHFIKVNGKIHCNSGHALVDAAMKGIGIVQLPDYYVMRYIEDGQLISLLDHLREPDDGIWAIYPHNRHLSPKVRMLLDYLGENLL